MRGGGRGKGPTSKGKERREGRGEKGYPIIKGREREKGGEGRERGGEDVCSRNFQLF